MPKVSEEHNTTGWCWLGTRTKADAGVDTRSGEVKVARSSEEMTPVLRDLEMAKELKTASQARGVERDKNELPYKATWSFTPA